MREVEQTVSPVYLVGGSVRDLIIGRTPKDYDFCTPLSPDEIEAQVKAAGRRAYLTGKRFGTIGFKCRGQFIEVTTFRSELYQPGNRKPEVEFVSDLQADLSRRDFTFNAIAWKDGQFFDPFGGRLDILGRKIKAVGEAKDRFKEDPLRMLRAARFASQLQFEVDPNMVGKIRKMPQKILDISRERWVQELDKLLVTDNPNVGILFLMNTSLLKYMIPELWLNFKNPQFLIESMLEISFNEKNADMRWGALLWGVGMIFINTDITNDNYPASFEGHRLIGKELVRGIALRLKFSNDRTAEVIDYVKKST